MLKDKAGLGVSWAGTKALMWAIEKRLDQAPGPVLAGPAPAASRTICSRWSCSARKMPSSPSRPSGPMLVFVHGTASSTLGSFGELRNGDRDLWSALERQFPGGIYAFEHRTLSESPIENAIQLVQALPRGAHVSLVSHSRGGLVADLLCLGDFDPLIDDFRYAFAGTGDADAAEAKRVIGELDGRPRASSARSCAGWRSCCASASRWCSATCAWPARPTAPSSPAATSTCSCRAC